MVVSCVTTTATGDLQQFAPATVLLQTLAATDSIAGHLLARRRAPRRAFDLPLSPCKVPCCRRSARQNQRSIPGPITCISSLHADPDHPPGAPATASPYGTIFPFSYPLVASTDGVLDSFLGFPYILKREIMKAIIKDLWTWPFSTK